MASVGLVELWLRGITDFEIYRPLDLTRWTALALAVFLIVEYALLWRVLAKARRLVARRGPTAVAWGTTAAAVGSGVVYAACPGTLVAPAVAVTLLALAGVAYGLRAVGWSGARARLAGLAAMAGLLSTTVFWAHEATTDGTHERYARALSDPRDTLAERAIGNLAADRRLRQADYAAAEAAWLADDYLSSNYLLDTVVGRGREALRPTQTAGVEFGTDDREVPVYRVVGPGGRGLYFRLRRALAPSAYTAAVPYKGLDALGRFQYVAVREGRVVLAEASTFDLGVLDAALPPVGEVARVSSDDFDGRVYRASASSYVLIGEPLSEWRVWLNLASVIVLAFLCLYFGGRAIRRLEALRRWRETWTQLAIDLRVQVVLIGSTVVVFAVVSAATFAFLAQNNQQNVYEEQLAIARSIRDDLLGHLPRDASGREGLRALASPEVLRAAGQGHVVDVDVYGRDGALVGSSLASASSSPAPGQLPVSTRALFARSPWAFQTADLHIGERHYVRTYFAVVDGGEVAAVVGVNTPGTAVGTAQDIPIIMNKLLSVYTVLLLMSWAVGLWLVEMLLSPVRALAEQIDGYELGAEAVPVAWAGRDGIGKLIAAYNAMVVKLAADSRSLAEREREGAWRVMAQQIAHEVNNSLAPLRMQAQYIGMGLSRLSAAHPSTEADLGGVRRMSETLVERVDRLASAAEQFQVFARSAGSVAEVIRPAGLLAVHLPGRRDHLRARLRWAVAPETYAIACALDRESFLRVVDALIDNAERALDGDPDGYVRLSLKHEDAHLTLRVEDNGPGIPAELHAELFDPTFAVDSSEAGLGLPIVKRLIALAGGRLSFETSPGRGTTFTVVLPVAGAPTAPPDEAPQRGEASRRGVDIRSGVPVGT